MDYNINIPKGWVNLSIVNDLNYVKTGVEEYEGEKEYFSTGSIKGNIVIPEGKYEYKKRPSRANRIAKLGDVLQARMKKTDKAILVDENLDGKLFSTGFFQIRADENLIHNKYLFYYLKSFNFNKIKDELCSGSTQEALNDQGAKKIYIPVPPIKEQYRIVNKISELFSEIDKGLENLRAIEKQLEVYRQAVLIRAFEGKIINTCIEEPIIDKVNNYCEFITKGSTPSKKDLSNSECEIPFLKVYNLTFNTILDFSINPTFVSKEVHTNLLKRSKVIPGDVLMNIVGPPLGKVSIVPNLYPEWNINQAIVRFRCKEKLYNKYLAYFLLCKDTVRKLEKQTKATAGQNNLTLEQCRNIEIPIYSIKTQYKIVNEIETRLSICDELKKTVYETFIKADYLKQSILKKAFEGKLVPQDPNDESVEKLLEKIKAERKNKKA